jgi:hypothetical protein
MFTWIEAGELVERYLIELSPPGPPDDATDWGATCWSPPLNARGTTALDAVRNLAAMLPPVAK